MEKVTIEVTVAAPCEKVWKVFTEPEHIMKWCSASPDWHAPRATNNLQVGGTFNTHMESIDGAQGFDFEGVYTEVASCELIAYTMVGGRTVRVVFKEEEGATHIVEIFDTEDENSVEMQRAGWQSILDNFKKYTESQT